MKKAKIICFLSFLLSCRDQSFLLPWRWRQWIPLWCRYIRTRWHSVTLQSTVLFQL